MTVATPIEPTARATLLDALRGFALFGVCLGNIATSFSFWDWPGTADLTPKHLLPTDDIALYLIHALVDGKFYSIFSLLFGLGFALQLGRRADTAAGLALYRRRLWILAGIGFVHSLVWMGDILLFYALMGMILVRLRTIEEARALRWVAILLVMPVILYLPLLLHPALMLGLPFFIGGSVIASAAGIDVNDMSTVTNGFVLGGAKEMATLSLPGIFFRWGDLLASGRPFKVLAMFVLGMVLGRRRIWEDLAAHTPMLRRVAFIGIGVGLPACLLLARNAVAIGTEGSGPGLTGLGDAALYAIGVAPLAMGYAAVFALLWQQPAWQRVLVWLAPTGRMALTNYLTQTLIGIIVFYGVGFGLGGRLGPTWYIPMALAILVLQTLFSQWWLARHQFGPMEGIWRKLTYRK